MIVCIQPFGRLAPGPLDLGAFECWCDGPDDTQGHSVLQAKNVVQRAVELIRPEMSVARRIDQLTINANPPLRLAHTSFQDVPDSELVANCLNIHGSRFVDEA